MRAVTILLVLGFVGLAGPLEGQSAERRIGGAEVRLDARGYPDEVRGELLAAMADTLWVEASHGGALVPLPFGDITSVRVRAHGAGAAWTMGRVALGWGATSLGLMVPCLQVGGVCGAVPLVVAVPWGSVGGVAALTNEAGTWLRFSHGDLEALRPYARFPQGLPDAMRP